MAQESSETSSRKYAGLSAAKRRQDRREKLIDAGYALFGTVGVPGTRIEGVCAEAGVGIRSLYDEFGSLEALFRAVYDRVIARAFQAVQVAMMAPRRDTTADPLTAAISAYLHEMLDDKRSGRIISIESARLDLALGTHRHDTLNRFASLARAYLDSSALNDEARTVWSIMFAGAINELVIHAVLSEAEPDIDTLAVTASQIWRRA